jgi:hypothetical protein
VDRSSRAASEARITVCVIRRGITIAFTAAVLAACGIAAASTVAAKSTPGGVTITVTVPDRVTSTTITVPRAATTTVAAGDAAQVRAALADPARISSVADVRTRKRLTTELHDLDSFLAPRPRLQPYRAHVWYVAHHSRTAVTPRALAALLWCTVWFPHDCR